MDANFKKEDKIEIIDIGGLGHVAIKLAGSKGAEVYAITYSPAKVEDIKSIALISCWRIILIVIRS